MRVGGWGLRLINVCVVFASQKYGRVREGRALGSKIVVKGYAPRMITDFISPHALRGQVAFITGGGGGINLAIGKALARLGANVGICGRTAERLETGRKELEAAGATVFTAVADVPDAAAVQAAVAACGAVSNKSRCD